MQIHIVIFEYKQFKLTKGLVITYTKESYTLPACLDIIYISYLLLQYNHFLLKFNFHETTKYVKTKL